MKFQKLMVAALGAAALGMATLTLTMDSNAQGGGPPQGPGQGPGAGPRPPGFPGQGGPGGAFPGGPGGGAGGQFRPGAGQFGGGGGGGTAMDSDNSFLYIVQGNMLFKVSKSDLRVLGSTPLMQMPQRGGDFPPAPGAPRSGGGAAAGGPPPPPSGQK